MNTSGVIWSEGEQVRRTVFHKRAVEGARAALAAIPSAKPKKVLLGSEPGRNQEPAPYVKDPVLAMPHWRRIVLDVCQKHGLRYQDIISARRPVPLVRARHEAMYRLQQETTMSLPAIGKRLGNRDHTTVMWGIRKHQQRMEKANA